MTVPDEYPTLLYHVRRRRKRKEQTNNQLRVHGAEAETPHTYRGPSLSLRRPTVQRYCVVVA